MSADCYREVAMQGRWAPREGRGGRNNSVLATLLIHCRPFEFLAATRQNQTTLAPGKNSFTAALIYALNKLLKEQPNSRFTAADVVRTIKSDAPHFPEDQNPVLADRTNGNTANHIVLHPLPSKNGSEGLSSQDDPSMQDNPSLQDEARQHTVTLHLDFHEKPSDSHIEKLGVDLSEVLGRTSIDIGGIRYRGMRCTDYSAKRAFEAGLEPARGRKRPNMEVFNGTTKWLSRSPEVSEHSWPLPEWKWSSGTSSSAAERVASPNDTKDCPLANEHDYASHATLGSTSFLLDLSEESQSEEDACRKTVAVL